MAKKNCVLCGEEYEEGQHCPSNHQFKKMCLNCSFCRKSTDGLTMTCVNEENKAAILRKMEEAMKAASGGYEIAEFKLEVKPLTLKKPINKCGQWVLSDVVVESFKKAFV